MDKPAHPVDADRDRRLVETVLPFGVGVIALFLTIARLCGLPL